MVIETEQEIDGRWIAEVPELPGVMVYAEKREDAIARVKVMALRIIAERIEHGEEVPDLERLFATHALANGSR